MKRLIIAFCCVLMWATAADAAWILFNKIEMGYFDRRGNPTTIAGKHNRFPQDAFYHGGTLSPDLVTVNVLERYETAGELLVRTNQEDDDATRFLAWKAQDLVVVERNAYTWERRLSVGKITRSLADFKARVLTEAEALATLKAWGKLSDQGSVVPESGVTK